MYYLQNLIKISSKEQKYEIYISAILEKMLTITDSNTNMIIEKRRDAVNLSQKLNATPYRNEWKNISEVLYNWGISISGEEIHYVVSTEQLTYLKMLLALPSW